MYWLQMAMGRIPGSSTWASYQHFKKNITFKLDLEFKLIRPRILVVEPLVQIASLLCLKLVHPSLPEILSWWGGEEEIEICLNGAG